MRYMSLCSGIEAASVAWRPLGWTPVAFAEVDPFPCAVLAHHHPDVPNWGDMTKFKEWPDAIFDVLVGGTPCQSFSVAGLRKGLADPRGNLALVYLAIADRYRPATIIWENVPGVLSSNGGRDFGAFLGGLAELGYGWAYRILDAQFVRVDGFGRAVPQRRRRVFVVGCLGDWRRAASILFERESLCWDHPPRRQAGQRASPTLAARARGGGGLGTDHDLDGGLIVDQAEAVAKSVLAGGNTNNPLDENLIAGTLTARQARARGAGMADGQLIAFGGNDTRGPIEVATAVNAHGGPHGRQDFESETFVAQTLRARDGAKGVDSDATDTLVVAHTLRADGFDASEDGTGRGMPLIAVPPVAASLTRGAESAGKGGYAGRRQEDDVNLVAEGHQPVAFDCKAGGHAAVAFQPRFARNGRGAPDEVAAPLTAEAGRTGKGDSAQCVATAWAVRRLTPTECERLQGFPDGHTAITFRGKPAADGPRYKTLGNSMPVNVMCWIGTKIQMTEEIG